MMTTRSVPHLTQEHGQTIRNQQCSKEQDESNTQPASSSRRRRGGDHLGRALLVHGDVAPDAEAVVVVEVRRRLQLRPLDESLEAPGRHGCRERAHAVGLGVLRHWRSGPVEQAEHVLRPDDAGRGVGVVEGEVEGDSVVYGLGVAVRVVLNAPAVAADGERGGAAEGVADADHALGLGVPPDLEDVPSGRRVGGDRQRRSAGGGVGV
jgi:hypothetical protein